MRRLALICTATTFFLAFMGSGCGGVGVAPTNFRSNSTSGTAVTTTTGGATNTGTTAPLVTVTPYRATLGAAQSLKFSASVTNSSKTELTWSITDCTSDCGMIAADGTYTAPPLVPSAQWVRINATLVSNPAYVGIAYVQLQPVRITITPAASSRLTTNATRSFQAAVQYDPTNRGVNWTLSGPGCSSSACGTLSDSTATSTVYHAPAVAPNPPVVALKATSITDANQVRVAAVFLVGASSQSVLQGKYAVLMQGTRSVVDYADGSDIAIAGHVDIMADGTVTGIWDATLTGSGGITEPVAGTYAAGSDGNGTLTLNSGTGTWKFAVAAQSAGDSAVVQQAEINPSAPAVTVQSGYLLRQDGNAFTLASVAGSHVVALTFSNVRVLGQWTANSAGSLTDGIMDLTWTDTYLHFFTTTTITGSFAAPDPLNGRGTLTLTAANGPDASGETFHFAYYIVSSDKMLLVELDRNDWQLPLLRGEARAQAGAGTFSNTSWNAPVVFNLSAQDAGSWWTPMAAVGQIAPTGSGSFASIWDQNQMNANDVTEILSQGRRSGTYTISPNGRVAMQVQGIGSDTNSYPAVAYLLDGNTGYFIHWAVFGTPFGYFEPQTAATFSAASLAGNFQATIAGPPSTFLGPADAGLVTLGADGTAAVYAGVDYGSGMQMLAWTGTYTLDPNGRGVMNLTDAAGGGSKSIVFWAVSADKMYAILSTSADDATPIVLQLQR